MSESISIEEFDTEEPKIREVFQVTDDLSADWAIRKLKIVRRKQAENTAILEAEQLRLQKWLETVNKDLENDAQYFEAVLRPYAFTQRSEGRKSVVLPNGTMKTLAGRKKVEIEDESKFIEWAKTSFPQAIRIKEEVAKKALTDLIFDGEIITQQGEIVPFVKVTYSEDTVSFNTD